MRNFLLAIPACLALACGGQTSLAELEDPGDDAAAPATGGTGGGSGDAASEVHDLAETGWTDTSVVDAVAVEASTTVDAGTIEECEPLDGGSGGTGQPDCDDLDGLIVTPPEVVDESGDGVISPGESASIRVSLQEVQGQDFMYYPGVVFRSDHPDVTVTNENWLYGIFACTSQELTSQAVFDASIAPGTVVTISAQVAMLSETCPGTASATTSITVQ